MGFKDEETQALIEAPAREAMTTHAVAGEGAGGAAPARQWDGAWWQVFGPRCDRTGLTSFALAYFMPCVAFGVNAKHALKASAWLHGLLYVAFFLVWRSVVNAAVLDAYAKCGILDDVVANMDAPSPRKMLGHHHHVSLEKQQSPECQDSLMAAGMDVFILLVSVIIGVVYAARCRTLLRKQLGIAGCWFKDLALWCCCAPCALCQETRTLAYNNVHSGTWHGPTRFVLPMHEPAPMAAPLMTLATKA